MVNNLSGTNIIGIIWIKQITKVFPRAEPDNSIKVALEEVAVNNLVKKHTDILGIVVATVIAVVISASYSSGEGRISNEKAENEEKTLVFTKRVLVEVFKALEVPEEVREDEKRGTDYPGTIISSIGISKVILSDTVYEVQDVIYAFKTVTNGTDV